jgi:hypothetical protein
LVVTALSWQIFQVKPVFSDVMRRLSMRFA